MENKVYLEVKQKVLDSILLYKGINNKYIDVNADKLFKLRLNVLSGNDIISLQEKRDIYSKYADVAGALGSLCKEEKNYYEAQFKKAKSLAMKLLTDSKVAATTAKELCLTTPIKFTEDSKEILPCDIQYYIIAWEYFKDIADNLRVDIKDDLTAILTYLSYEKEKMKLGVS